MRYSLIRWTCYFACTCSLVACVPSGDANLSYLDRLATFESQLTISSPAPQNYSNDEPPEGVQVVHYLSGDMSLKAWLASPDDVSDKKRPGVVYIHGGFAFGTGDFIDAQSFRDAGFVVMTPMLRGENGNPGNFELFLGEVDDAASAVKWLASQPFIDPKRLYVFGHSTGGGISALLTLRTNIPIVHTGSSGGLYPSNVFSGWRDIVPFDLNIEEERDLRLLLGNLRWMQIPHFSFLGESDSLVSSKRIADREAAVAGSKLTVTVLPGDHYSSLQSAIDAYIDMIIADDESE